MKQQKTDRRSQRTHRLVGAALAELLVEKPYEELLVQDILDRAGIGRTTFYAHYFDKKDVLFRLTIVPWLLATSEDLRYGETEGRRMFGLELCTGT